MLRSDLVSQKFEQKLQSDWQKTNNASKPLSTLRAFNSTWGRAKKATHHPMQFFIYRVLNPARHHNFPNLKYQMLVVLQCCVRKNSSNEMQFFARSFWARHSQILMISEIDSYLFVCWKILLKGRYLIDSLNFC